MDSAVEQLHSRVHSLVAEFREGGGTNYLDEAIVIAREALEFCPPGHHQRFISLTWLGYYLNDRYRQLERMGDLEEAIVFLREALELCSSSQDYHDRRHWALNNLGTCLSARYEQLGDMENLDEAIVLHREELDLCPEGHTNRSTALNDLGICLSTRYKQLGDKKDLDEAISLDREALDLRPKGHPNRSMSLNSLGADLVTRYDLLGVMEDLDEATVLNQEALDLHPHGHPDRPTSLINLALCLSSRYNGLGSIKDLDQAIALNREAVELCPQGNPDRAVSLINLSAVLTIRYNQFGAVEDLDEAIVLDREALKLFPQGHPERSMSLGNLAVDLSIRYNQVGIMEDLNEAIVLDRAALSLRPQGHPDRSISLNNLANCLYTRYTQLGSIEDLQEAIVLSREALQLRPQGHPSRSMSLACLAVDLSAQYDQLGTMEDLDESILLHQEALDLRPQGHPDRSSSLNGLALCLARRYRELGVAADLEKAIVFHREALGLRPQGHPDRFLSLNNLAVSLSNRYDRYGVMDDLDEAIALHREVLRLYPEQHPDRSMSLNNLSVVLSTRYKQLLVVEDLDEAISLVRKALDLIPQGHPDRSSSLENLAQYLRDRYTRSMDPIDKEEAFDVYAQLVHASQTVSVNDLRAARKWISAAEDLQHPTLLLAHETSIRLLVLHLATLPPLPQHLTVLKNLASSLAVEAFSACLHGHAPARAVELLEQGRGVFWNQVTFLRSPLDEVIASGPEGKSLAGEFNRLSSVIRSAFNPPGEDQRERACRLNFEIQKVVTDIRSLPGFSHFLLPSPFSDLRYAASEGPVIIVNASKHGCDALIVFLDRDPVHIPLQIKHISVQDLATEIRVLTRRAMRGNLTRELAAFSRKLWDQIVSPIVDVLQTILPLQSRIWWCPTAEFSVLPLHAASPFRKGQRGLLDLYISSYTPTLTALIRARRSDELGPEVGSKRFLAIGQAKATGESELHSVGAELENIRQHVDAFATFTRIDGEASCVPRVVEELGKNEWVHLACHGLPNRTQPFESAFALHDGHFTIQQIIGFELKNHEFAYLSACHTTAGDEESPDEVIHLASAMQFAGFRSVIGTMWAVDDSETNKITSTFYKYMVDESGRLDHTRAAYALNKTMKSIKIPFDQRILYIHIGA